MRPTAIVKRDGQTSPFDQVRIAAAIYKSMCAVGDDDRELSDELGQVVTEHLERIVDRQQVDLEEVQDAVVHVLQESGQYRAAIAYTRYRDERERQRRTERLQPGTTTSAPNLLVLDSDGRYRRWDHGWLTSVLTSSYGLDERTVAKVLPALDVLVADTAAGELGMAVVLSLIDTALVRLGMHAVANQRSGLRVDRAMVSAAIRDGVLGERLVMDTGRDALRQWSLLGCYSTQVLRWSAVGRLWFDGADDPRRGSQFTVVLDNLSNPWQILTSAFALAQDAQRSWRRVRLVLPPSILGHLERGPRQFLAPISALAEIAQVFLACDGRTPLLAEWPFPASAHRHPVSIAVAHDDFLVMRQVQELSLPLLAGPHLFQPGWRSRIAVELAVNAQGLESDYATLDALAMAVVSAAKVRIQQLGDIAEQADVRYAISGLPAHTPSTDYLQRQVIQEGQRVGLTLVRGSNLSEDACAHLGRLLE